MSQGVEINDSSVSLFRFGKSLECILVRAESFIVLLLTCPLLLRVYW